MVHPLIRKLGKYVGDGLLLTMISKDASADTARTPDGWAPLLSAVAAYRPRSLRAGRKR